MFIFSNTKPVQEVDPKFLEQINKINSSNLSVDQSKVKLNNLYLYFVIYLLPRPKTMSFFLAIKKKKK